MKKIILIMLLMFAMMNLVSCGKEGPTPFDLAYLEDLRREPEKAILTDEKTKYSESEISKRTEARSDTTEEESAEPDESEEEPSSYSDDEDTLLAVKTFDLPGDYDEEFALAHSYREHEDDRNERSAR